MNNDELAREARRVLEPLRVSEVAISSENEALQTRERALPNLVAMIERVPEERARVHGRRRLLRVGVGAAGAVAMAAGVLLWLQQAGDSSDLKARMGSSEQLIVASGYVTEGGEQLMVGSRYAIDQLGRLSTPHQSGAELVADGGVRIGFAADSTADLAFLAKSRRIALNRGKVSLEVPPLEKGAKLSVSTPNAVVVVHGTKFSVEYTGADTCVRVREGIVSVQREASHERLTAGMQSGCGEQETTPSKVAGTTSEAIDEPVTQMGKGGVRPKAGVGGTLNQENMLFRRALAAEQEQDLGVAEANLRRLLERYPHSPLAGEARRVLARVRAARGSSSMGR